MHFAAFFKVANGYDGAGASTKDVALTDDRGRRVFVPAGSLAYVELGEAAPRRVGFGI